MNPLKPLLYPIFHSLAQPSKSLTSGIPRSFFSTQWKSDLSSHKLHTTLRGNISTIKVLPSLTSLEGLEDSSGKFQKRARGEERGFVTLSRAQNQGMCLQGALRGQYVTVHANPVGTDNDIDPALLSALVSPVRQYCVVDAKRLLPNAPKGEAFGPYVAKLCNAYLHDGAKSLVNKELEDLKYLSLALSSLAEKLEEGHRYLEKLQEVLDPADLGLKQHHVLPRMGIIPINGSPQGYENEALGEEASLLLFLAVCKAKPGSQHPVALRVDMSKDPTAFKSFVDQALKGADQIGVPATVINDWTRFDRRTSEDAQHIEANLQYVQKLVAANETVEQQGTNPPLTLLLNASKLDAQTRSVKLAYQEYAQKYEPLAFSHNGDKVGLDNPLYNLMLKQGTIEVDELWEENATDEQRRTWAAIKIAMVRIGPPPECWRRPKTAPL